MRGRLPTPTPLRLRRGNPGHRPINEEEPKIPAVEGSAQPPPHLTEGAKEEWLRLAPSLIASGLLTLGDLAVFEAYCSYWDEWMQYSRLAEAEEPWTAKHDKYGNLVGYAFSPARRVRDEAADNLFKAMVELGLTPSSRSRVRKATPQGRAWTAEDVRKRLRSDFS